MMSSGLWIEASRRSRFQHMLSVLTFVAIFSISLTAHGAELPSIAKRTENGGSLIPTFSKWIALPDREKAKRWVNVLKWWPVRTIMVMTIIEV